MSVTWLNYHQVPFLLSSVIIESTHTGHTGKMIKKKKIKKWVILFKKKKENYTSSSTKGKSLKNSFVQAENEL